MQAKTKKKLLIVGWLAVFLLLVTTFSSVNVAHATVTQCSDGLDNDGDGMIDANDPNCHTDVNAYNISSYNPNLSMECGYACSWKCPYKPKAGRIIVQFDQSHNIKSNGTVVESKMPAVAVNIPVGHYNISMESFDGYVGRPTSPSQPNETWKALLMKGSNLVAETTHTIDLSDNYSCFAYEQDNIQNDFFVAEDIDSVVAQHAGYPDISSPNDLWPVCIAFDDVLVVGVNQPPVINLLGSDPMSVVINTAFTDPGATATDLVDGSLTGSITITGTVNTSVIGVYHIFYTVVDSGGLTDTTTRTVSVVPATYAQCPPENQPPVITLLGLNPITIQQNTTFTDPWATSSDPEDGDLTTSITATGTVNVSATGTYARVYSVVDSGGLIATTSRTVNVVLATTTNQAPVITITGALSLEIFVGDVYTDQGATATDTEDGNITNKVIATSTVNASIAGTYNVRYNATDSQNLAAVEKVRTVVVKAKPSGCVGSCGGGGGGGGGGISYSTSLIIFEEKVVSQSATTALVTWKTDTSADSRVVYSTSSVNNIAMNSINYGYVYTTLSSSTMILSHSMLITGLLPGVSYYFRPVSDNPYVNPVIGKEVRLIISQGPIVIAPQVALPVVTECNYLLEYLRIDLVNNPIEVIKLQKFLKENENFTDLQVNGVFGQTTLDAVNIFQMRYFADVLSPWGYAYNDPTGYVYITTKKKVNELYCKRPFPLTQEQIDEIVSVRNEGSFLQTSPSPTTTLGITEPIPTEPITTEPSKPIQELVAGATDQNQKDQDQSIFSASILANLPSAKTFLVVALILIILSVGLIILFVAIRHRKRIVNAEELIIQ